MRGTSDHTIHMQYSDSVNVRSSISTCWCTSSWSIWVRYSSPGGQPGMTSWGADIHCTGCCGAGVGGWEGGRDGWMEGGRRRGEGGGRKGK